MTRFITVTPEFAVAGQLAREEFATAAAEGYRLIVNNRPDGEAPDQLPGAEAEAAAKAAGMAYRAIPVSGGPSPAAINETLATLEAADGPVLAYCNSGRRSIALWALAQAKARSRTTDELVRLAEAAGYDIGRLRTLLDQLAQG